MGPHVSKKSLIRLFCRWKTIYYCKGSLMTCLDVTLPLLSLIPAYKPRRTGLVRLGTLMISRSLRFHPELHTLPYRPPRR